MIQQAKPIDIVCCTNWELSPYHIPLIVAKYKGYFNDENLRVATIHPEDVSDVTEIVGSGKADLGLKAMIHTLAGKARGYPIKSIGTLMDEPFTGLLYLEGNGVTEDFRSLKGKRIGYVGEFGKVQVAELAQSHGMGTDEYEAVRCGMNISKVQQFKYYKYTKLNYYRLLLMARSMLVSVLKTCNKSR